MNGICKYCGAVVMVADCAEPDEEASAVCGCTEARRKRKLTESVEACCEKIVEMFGSQGRKRFGNAPGDLRGNTSADRAGGGRVECTSCFAKGELVPAGVGRYSADGKIIDNGYSEEEAAYVAAQIWNTRKG